MMVTTVMTMVTPATPPVGATVLAVGPFAYSPVPGERSRRLRRPDLLRDPIFFPRGKELRDGLDWKE